MPFPFHPPKAPTAQHMVLISPFYFLMYKSRLTDASFDGGPTFDRESEEHVTSASQRFISMQTRVVGRGHVAQDFMCETDRVHL